MRQEPKSITKNHGRAKNAWIVGVALMVMLIGLAYLPALRGGFIWDDDDYVTQNQTLHDLSGLKQIWFKPGATSQYYPLVYSTFWLEYHLWQLDSWGYHVVNVALHALAAVLLWRVLVRLQISGAGLAASIFALHPVCVESVAWITERKNVLSTVFYFAAALAWLRFVQNSEDRNKNAASNDRKQKNEPFATGITSANSSGPWPWYFLSLVFFVAALLSKTVTCSLPAALLLVCWWKNGRLRAGDIWPLLPFFILGIVLGLNTALVEKHHVGASGPEWALALGERGLIAGQALWFYAGKLVWPANLAFIYPRWEIHTAAGWHWLFPVAAVVVIAALWHLRHRIGRGPLVAVLFFAGTLFPALGFVNVYPMRYSFVADHFQYLASVGLIVLAAAGLTRWCSASDVFPVKFTQGIILLLPLLLGFITWKQSQIYHDLETLWRDTASKNPGSWLAQNNLGVTLWNQGKTSEAIGHYEQALRADPNSAETHNNLGVALRQTGNLQEAIEHYEQTLRLNPDFFEAHCNLGGILIELGRMPEAAGHYQEAVRIRPDSAEAHYNWGVALERLGKRSEAREQYQQTLQCRPDFAEAHNNLALILWQTGQAKEAIAHWEQALRIKPDYAEAQNSLAWLLATLRPTEGGDPARAVALAKRTCELTGSHDANVLDTLAVAYAAAGRFNEAIATTQTALELARSGGQAELLRKMESRLELYRSGQTYRPPLSH